MAEDIRLSVGADTTQMESQIANAARKATVVIRPTIDSKGLEKISAPLGRITGQADEFTKSMEAANARVLAFGASVGVLNAVAKSFQNIVTASTQVEASLKEIQVATGETTGNLERLGKGIFEVARSTGLSFKQASEATLEFARQGGTLEDSLMKAKAALVLTRTTGLDAAEAVKGLTAAVLSFNQVGLDYETVVNKLAAVDTKFAVSSRDLIEGISRSASVAQEAGVSFDELTALITTLQEKTARGGAVIGNALKTIFQRVQTTENLDYIRNLGIAVNDVSGDILPATTIIKKLADEFQNLDSATRKGLLIKIGGGFQIDKLAALLNDISSANGTFNRSLQQSTNAGNQGFQKLEELNKTVQASFDRLTTSGTQFAATIGKIAFSDDFRSILNKTSSFLESLNESISGGEEGGATIGKAIVKGIGSIITGPGALLIAGLGIKLFGDLAKFGVDSLKNQLGVTNVKKEQQDIEKSILGLLLQNTAVQTKIVSLEGNKTAQAEYLLGLYSKQAATLEKMSKLSKDIGPSVYEGGIRLTAEGTKNVKAKTAAGGYMSKDAARRMEMREAPAGASIKEISNFNFGPKEGRGTMIVNSMESVYKTPMGDFVVPSYSKTRTGKPTLFSASGYVPNFAEKQEEEQKANLLRSLTIDGGAYSFAGLTIGGTGSKSIRSKELNPQLLSKIKDPALASALSKYNKLNFSNVSVGNVYRRRDQNLDSLEAGEEQIKDHFIKKANSALSPQIGSFIKDELDSLGIKPTASMQYAIKSGKKFDFVNESMAGSFFETMLKLANMSASDENFGQFFNDLNSSFDIYGLKPDIAEQYGLPKRFWEYVEIKSSEKALNDELGTKFITQLSQPGGESLKAKFLTQAKTGSKGYVPNFFKRKISSLKKSQSAGNLGFYYDDGSEKQNNDDYLQSGNVKINRKKNKKNAQEYRNQASDLIQSARDRGDYSYIKNTYGPYISDKFEYNKVLDKKIKGNSLGGLISNLQGAIAEKNFHDELSSYIKEENFNAGVDFYSRDSKRLVEIKARQTALTQGEANAKVLAFLGSRGKGRKNNKSENLDDLLNNIDFTVYESNYKAKTASRGYVPNFAGTKNFEGSASRFGYKIGQVYNQGEEAIKSTFDNPKTAFGGTRTGEAAYGVKYGFKVDEKGIIASILGNNTFVAGKDQRQELETLATRLSAQGATMKGSQNMLGLNISRLNTRPENVISANIKGKFKKIDYEKLDKVFPRFWKSKGLGQVWENSKLHATFTGANKFGGITGSPHTEILRNPEVRKLIDNPNLARENNALLRNSAVEAVLKKDPSIAGFLVDLAGSSEEEYLRGTKEKSGISYAMPFSGSPFSDIESVGVKKDAVKRAEQERRINETKKAYRERGVLYREFVKNKSEFLKYGKWGGDGYYKNGVIYLQPDANKTAAKGYIPNFSQKAILDAIGREQKESGLPLSAIKVVQDARVRGPQNPSGYAVINNRDEPDGRVPNFSDPPKTDPPQIRQDLFNAIEEALGRLENSTKSLDESFARIATNLGTSAETVVQVLDKITTSGNAAAESTQKATESGKKNTDQGNKDAQGKKTANEKETKTTQDALYNLVKFQTALSFATGAMSSFGKSGEKLAEILSSVGQSAYLFSQAKELGSSIAGEGGISGGFKAGKEAAKAAKESGGSQVGAFIKGGGGMATLGFLTAGAGYAVAAYEGIKALDAGMQIWNGTVAKSEKFIEDLTTASEKYNIQLSEQQKRVVSAISEKAAGGADIGSQVSIGLSKFFNTEEFKTFGDLKGLVDKTKLSTDAQKTLLEKLGNVIAPQATRELTTDGNPNPTTGEIQLKTIEILNNKLREFEKQATSYTPLTKEEVLQKFDFSDKSKNITSGKRGLIEAGYNEMQKIEKNLPSIQNRLQQLKDPSLAPSEEAQQELIKLTNKESELQTRLLELKKQTGQITLDASKFQKLITEFIKEEVAPAQQAAYAESQRQEALLINANLLKEELDIQAKLKQLELSRISPRENFLSIEKDLLSTSEARRSSIDLELKQLEEQRRLQLEIKSIVVNKGQQALDKYLGMTGSSLTQGRKEELKGGFQKIIDAGSIKESEDAIKKFNSLLSFTKKTSEEQTQEIQKQIEAEKIKLENLKTAANYSEDEVKKQEESVKAEQKKLEAIGASNVVLESMLRIMGQQIDYAKKATAEKLRQNAQDSLNLAITKQQNFYFNTERDSLRAQLTLKDQALQKEKERLGYLREIQDAEVILARIGKDTPKDRFSQRLEDIQLEANRRKEDLKTRNQEIANANKSKVVQRLSERPETMALAREALNAKTQDDLISALEKAYSVDEKSFRSSVISAAEEFKKIVIQTAQYITPSSGTDETSPAEGAIDTAKKQAIQYGGINKKGYTKDFEDQSFSLITKSNQIQNEIERKQIELNEATSNGYDEAIIDDLNKQINTLQEDLKNVSDKLDSLSFTQDPFALPPEKPDRKTIAAAAGLEQPLDQKGPEASINKNAAAQAATAVYAERSRTEFGLGMKESLKGLNTEIEQFGNTLGKQIPMDFRNGLVEAMKALSDPNATTSLKERLMGIAAGFLNKINEAFMTQTANQITRGIFGNGTGAGIMEGGGLLKMASGGKIEGGSGVKDDVPTMLMGGEYVIKKNVVNKYGKDFFDRLNSGKIKGFANGGLATFNGFEAADVKDTVINPTNYVPYGETRMGGLSFDENGRVIGMDSYTGDEQGKQNALMQAQTNFYSQMAQTGKDGFFMPGKYGQGAIIGQQNLLSYASQDTIGTQFDKFSSMGNMAGIDIAGGSANLSLFALRDQGNIRNAEYIESKNKALDLYLGGIGAEKEKYAMDEQNRKEYEQLLQEMEQAKEQAKKQAKKQMQGILIQAGISLAMAGVGALANSAMAGKTAAQQAFASGQEGAQKPGFFTGMWSGAKINGETFGGMGNALSFNSNAFKTANLLGVKGGGALLWNAEDQSYQPLDTKEYEAMFPFGASWSSGMAGTRINSPLINTGGNLPSKFDFSKLNPMNWFSRGGAGASTAQMSNIAGFDYRSLKDGEVSWNERTQTLYDNQGPIKYNMPTRKAAGGTVQGNGMGDNVPAMLNGGEFVMSKQAAQKIGYNNLQQMNSNPQDSGSDITSRIEAKLEELFDKVSGVGTINISVTSDGKGGKKDSEESSNQDQQNKELARKMKEVVLNVLREEKRLGGLLR